MIQISRTFGGNPRINPPHGNGGAYLLLRNKELPARLAGGLYITHEPRYGFVAAIPSRAFRDGMGIFASRLPHRRWNKAGRGGQFWSTILQFQAARAAGRTSNFVNK
jgi:hypothetical protein